MEGKGGKEIKTNGRAILQEIRSARKRRPANAAGLWTLRDRLPDRDALRDPPARHGRVVGSTRFWKIDRANRKQEIGHTWLGRLGAALGRQHRGEVSAAAPTPSRPCTACACSSPPTSSTRNRAPRSSARREAGRHRAARADHAGRPQAQLGALQHHRQRMARGEGDAGRPAGPLAAQAAAPHPTAMNTPPQTWLKRRPTRRSQGLMRCAMLAISSSVATSIAAKVPAMTTN